MTWESVEKVRKETDGSFFTTDGVEHVSANFFMEKYKTAFSGSQTTFIRENTNEHLNFKSALTRQTMIGVIRMC